MDAKVTLTGERLQDFISDFVAVRGALVVKTTASPLDMAQCTATVTIRDRATSPDQDRAYILNLAASYGLQEAR